MKKAPLFASLSQQHEALDRLFDSHQRGLFAGDIDLALAALSKFSGDLERHIEFEERRVLPLYADQAAETPGATLEIVQAEHRKLQDGVATLIRRTEELFEAPDLPGAILALLSEEAMFKSLFHHHAAREEKILFPRLDQLSTEEERQTWLSETN